MLRYVSSVLTVAMAAAVFPGPAQAAKPDPSITLDFATYNICKTSCGSGRFTWERRKDAAVRNIIASRADVVALQEVDNSYPWLAEQLGKHGYRRVETSASDCRNACVDDSHLFYRTATVAQADLRVASDPIPAVCTPYLGDQEPPFAEPTWPTPGPEPQPPTISPRDPDYGRLYDEYLQQLSEYERANDAAREAYDDAEDDYWAQVRAWEKVGRDNNCGAFRTWQPFTSVGFGAPDNASVVPRQLARAADNRNFAWAVLRDRRSGSVFLATSVHLPNEKSGPAEKLRKALAAGIRDYLAKQRQDLGLQGAPSIVMGDLNSYRQRQPRGAQWVLGKQGYRDAFTAKRTVNADVPTVNVTTKYRDPFPAKPFHLDQPARLDYVFVEGGTPVRYELQLHVRNGRFDNRYRASDHNLVKAQLRLPRVPLPDRWK